MKRLFIDSDLKVSSALALCAGFMEENYEIVGISTTNGALDLEDATNKALGILDILDWDIPVYKGCENPLSPASKINYPGEDDSENLFTFPNLEREVESISASEAIYRFAQEDGKLDLLILGPLTNLATALDMFPDLPEYIGDVFIMGGALNGGNVTSYSEFNFYADPLAVKKVLESGLSLFINGLDTVSTAAITAEAIKSIENSNNPAKDFINHQFNSLITKGLNEDNLISINDLVALYAYSMKESIIYEEIYVNIYIDNDDKRGQLYVPDLSEAKGYPVYYGTKLNPKHFEKYILEKLNI